MTVPARKAWPEYQSIHAYVCQPDRTFQPVERMAFYSAGSIQPLVPLILHTEDRAPLERGKNRGWLAEIVEQILSQNLRPEGAEQKIILLSAPDDPRTIKLQAPVLNNLRSAFTQNQRYVSLDSLRKAKTTSQLERAIETAAD